MRNGYKRNEAGWLTEFTFRGVTGIPKEVCRKFGKNPSHVRTSISYYESKKGWKDKHEIMEHAMRPTPRNTWEAYEEEQEKQRIQRLTPHIERRRSTLCQA